ncbi:CDF family Co(II)/Ni(II) efflux transporter DmeF [Caulobacter endophyticus]|uniref:CDF family Co(II)/Ni(II) efflux transporter DmeF n=1 Tax=Caulobacter endophyticus TaxID=2172652 RepID=UPI00240F9A5C|nr:CDF family Co(II)/Ni(II) efflux transporter DmeF [Caulobacter endophyticus]MDG2529253.1 CDF family Co(II)/Ni(II) efflux transporter DmeF [Caulobacter endophyticus]
MTAAVTAPPHPHDHVFLAADHDANARRTLWVVALTAVMMVVEILAGWWTGSMALLADGFHMATHAGALAVAAAAYAYARKHATSRRYSFGTGKVGDLAGFASALVLAVVAIGVAVESVRRLFEPSSIAFIEAIVIAVVGLAVNLASAALLSGGHHHGHHHHRHDHHHDHGHDHHHDHGHDHGRGHGHDNNLRSAYMHVLADALTSVLAIVALIAGRQFGWTWLDPIMGVVGAVVIGRWAWGLMRDTAAILLDATDDHVADEMRELLEVSGDARILDLHVWKVGPQAHAAIVSVAGLSAQAVRERLTPVHELRHLTVEVA